MILKERTYLIITIAFFFSGGNLMSLAFPLATKLLLLISLTLLFKLSLNNNAKLNFKYIDINVKIILISLFIFVLFNNISSLINAENQISLFNLIKHNIY